MKAGILEKIYSQQWIDSQLGKVKLVQKSNIVGTHSGVSVPFVRTHQNKTNSKKARTHYIRMNLLSKYFLPIKGFLPQCKKIKLLFRSC